MSFDLPVSLPADNEFPRARAWIVSLPLWYFLSPPLDTSDHSVNR